MSSASDQTYVGIRATMKAYSTGYVFEEYADSFVYVERTLSNGSIRSGIVGVIDLEAYDYHADSKSAIRATERTVVERIPPRMKVRRGASLEHSHVLLLCDDDQFSIIEPMKTEDLSKLYDIDLLQGGGHIVDWLVDGDVAERLKARIEDYCENKVETLAGMLFAVGDGNHSLATAKECYEELKKTSTNVEAINRARYAMVELENIHDPVQGFEPIHRLLRDVEVSNLISFVGETCCADDGYSITWVSGDSEGTIYLDKEKGVLPVGIIQTVLDEYLKMEHGEIDYIHGEETLRKLAKKEDSIGFLLPAIPKDDFFRRISKDGVLPRKTFSMGEAQEKRYYLEARRL